MTDKPGDQTVRVVDRGNGLGLMLGGELLRSPGGRPVIVPSRELAEALAAEIGERRLSVPKSAGGGDQGPRVDFAAGPFLRLVVAWVDFAALNHSTVVDEIARYAETDLLCYRTDAPRPLAMRQEALWQPPLDWAAKRFEARLRVTPTLVPVTQLPQAIANIRAAIAAYPPIALPALHQATRATGSAILALALAEGAFALEEIAAAAFLDETFQNEQWGTDEEAASRRSVTISLLEAAARFLDLWRKSAP